MKAPRGDNGSALKANNEVLFEFYDSTFTQLFGVFMCLLVIQGSRKTIYNRSYHLPCFYSRKTNRKIGCLTHTESLSQHAQKQRQSKFKGAPEEVRILKNYILMMKIQ